MEAACVLEAASGVQTGTNVQWVFVVQAEDDKGNFDSVPPNFSAILNAVNLEMIERPDMLNPPVTAAAWEKTTVTSLVVFKVQTGN